MRHLLKRLPGSHKRRIWSIVDKLGQWPQRIRVGPARGLVLVAPLRRNSSYCAGEHEPHVLNALSEIAHPGAVALDIGSHLGYFTLALARLVGNSGHIYAFEPAPQHVRSLRRTVARNRLAQVTVVPEAVGDRTGVATLEEWANDSMHRILSGGRPRPGPHHTHVRVTTLDDWFAQQYAFNRLDLIKLDIEGQELAALRGARETLAKYRPQIICEIHRRADVPYSPCEIISWLGGAQYTVSLIPTLQRPDESLDAAVIRLMSSRPPPGWMTVAHIVATPRPS